MFYYVPLVDHWGSENPHQYFPFQASPEFKQALLPERVACKSSEALASKIKFISTVSSISEAYSSLQLSPSGKFLENLMWNPHFGTSLGQRIDNQTFLSFSLLQRVYFLLFFQTEYMHNRIPYPLTCADS